MTKTEKYLYKRLDALSEEKVVLITKINKITIEIEEVEEKMEEIANELDTAFEMFSPKPKKNDFNRNEIERLAKRKEELVALRDEFVKQCMVVEEDMVEIKESLGEEYDEELASEINENEAKEQMVYGFRILHDHELEKQKFAGRLNDDTLSVINNMIHKCDICEKILEVDSARAGLELEIISKSLRDMQTNIKDIIFELKPADYKNINIELSLERMINLMRLNTEMNMNINIKGDKKKYSPVIEMSALRIIQEAAVNSIKYSEGKNLNINLIYEEELLKIEIIDDGKGIDFKNIVDDYGDLSSLGLSIIRERAYLLGGGVNISSDQKGTKITVMIPISN